MYVTALPRLIPESWVPLGPAVGTMPVSPVAPAPTDTRNVSVLLLQATSPYEDELRPSIQVSICFPLTIGTPRACAEVRRASFCGIVAASVCMFAVKAP